MSAKRSIDVHPTIVLAREPQHRLHRIELAGVHHDDRRCSPQLIERPRKCGQVDRPVRSRVVITPGLSRVSRSVGAHVCRVSVRIGRVRIAGVTCIAGVTRVLVVTNAAATVAAIGA